MEQNYTILILDEMPLFQKAIEVIIMDTFKQATVIKTNNFEQALNYSNCVELDLVIMDIQSKGKFDFSIINQLKLAQQNILILVMSFLEKQFLIDRCYKHGANGYLPKNCSETELKMVLKHVLLKSNPLINKSSGIKVLLKRIKKNKESNIINQLSQRELQLAIMFINGKSNATISKELKLATSTIGTYKNRILKKTKTTNIIELYELYNSVEGN